MIREKVCQCLVFDCFDEDFTVSIFITKFLAYFNESFFFIYKFLSILHS